MKNVSQDSKTNGSERHVSQRWARSAPAGRLTTKTYPDQTGVTYIYDPLSRLTQVSDPSGNYSFTYDNLGRLTGTGTQYSFLGSALNNSYGYDAASNRVSFTNPQSQFTNYNYDSLNRLTSLADPNTGSFGFGYDALGRRTSLTRPNGVGTSYSYDTLSRLLSVLHNGGGLPGSTSYSYDAAGNRLTKTAVQEASPNPVSVLSQFSYDNIYELTQAVVGGTVAEGYSYDAVGNRLTSAGPTSYNYNVSNELTSTSAATYQHDNNGNSTSKTDTNGTTSYSWDYENRLTQLTLPGQGGTVYFNYDPFGRRIRKSSASGTTIYAYDGANVTEELNSSGIVTADYTQSAGIDEPLAMYRGAATSYYHADGLGSITSLTDSAGNLAASYVYDSFGNLTASTASSTNPFLYTARELDSETGLYYYRARYYDPVAGRFLSQDPIGFFGGINFYAYVRGNATNAVDPDGLACLPKCQDLSLNNPVDFWNNNYATPDQVDAFIQSMKAPASWNGKDTAESFIAQGLNPALALGMLGAETSFKPQNKRNIRDPFGSGGANYHDSMVLGLNTIVRLEEHTFTPNVPSEALVNGQNDIPSMIKGSGQMYSTDGNRRDYPIFIDTYFRMFAKFLGKCRWK